MLRAPGPTTCPPEVLSAMAKQMTGLNSPEIPELVKFAESGIKNLLFSPSSDINVCLFAASGTGAMEAAVCNFFSPGDSVVVCTSGAFGDRFAEIALAFGLKVNLLTRPLGYGFNPADFGKDFKRIRKIFGEQKAVFFTHNETSSGVTNPVEELARIVHNTYAMTVVDVVSSFVISPLKMMDWGIDVVVGGVQKGLMTPPALSFVAFNEYAKQAYRRSTMPRFYFDVGKYIEAAKNGQTPFTPAIPQLRALKEAITLLYREGIDVYDRHRRMAGYVRERVTDLDLEIVAKEYFSDGVTAIKVPEGIKAEDIIRNMREGYGIEIAGGAGELAGETIRIGHMGYLETSEITVTFEALRRTLGKLRNSQKTIEK
ncbi:MAG: alanine--glyoxylate aminotransferase family protein [Patescibacteria group bacterium]